MLAWSVIVVSLSVIVGLVRSFKILHLIRTTSTSSSPSLKKARSAGDSWLYLRKRVFNAENG